MGLVLIAASTVLLACPATIETKQEVVGQLDGWRTHVQPVKHPLYDVGIYDGDPKLGRSLVILPTQSGYRWEVRNTDTWVQCSYRGTSLVLTRVLKSGTTCELRREQGDRSRISFSCE
jgi:outer membrane biogenesis lipoprotein LolB